MVEGEGKLGPRSELDRTQLQLEVDMIIRWTFLCAHWNRMEGSPKTRLRSSWKVSKLFEIASKHSGEVKVPSLRAQKITYCRSFFSGYFNPQSCHGVFGETGTQTENNNQFLRFAIKSRSIVCYQHAVLSARTSQVRCWKLHERHSKYISHLGWRMICSSQRTVLNMRNIQVQWIQCSVRQKEHGTTKSKCVDSHKEEESLGPSQENNSSTENQ